MLRINFFILFFLITTIILAQDFSISQYDMKNYRGLDAVIKNKERILDIKNHKSFEFTDRVVISVFNKKGFDAVEGYAFYNNSRKIRKLSAEIYNAEGKLIKKIKTKDFIDRSAVSNATLYADNRVKYLNYSPNNFPYTIVIEKSIKDENTALIPSYRLVSDPYVKVENLSYKILYDKDDNQVELELINLSDILVNRIEDDDGIYFTSNDLPVFKEEKLTSVKAKRFPAIKARLKKFNLYGYKAEGIETWEELGDWYYSNLVAETAKISADRREEINQLTKEASTDLEKAKIVYEYVQDNLRYISVQIGVGGLQPIAADEVDEVKYGDCKGLANYTRALLASIDVKSYLAIIQAGEEKEIVEKDFPNLWYGNHMILAIENNENEDNYTWVDCTSKINPFGYLGSFTDDRQAFLIKPEGSKIVRTPSYKNKDNLKETTATIEFTEHGKLKVDGEIINKGVVHSDKYHLLALNLEELNSYDKREWKYINNLKVLKHEVNFVKNKMQLTEEFTFTGSNFGNKTGNKMMFPLNVLNPYIHKLQKPQYRENDFQIGRGFYDKDRINIKIPENYQIKLLPKDFELETSFGFYKRKIKVEENYIILEKELFIKANEYSKDDFQKFYNFNETISEEEKSNVIIELKNI